MKNKKLFAILTLVCFLFTLMPFAAFAAPTAAVDNDFSLTTDAQGNVVIDVTSLTATGTTRSAYVYTHASPSNYLGKVTVDADGTRHALVVAPAILPVNAALSAVVMDDDTEPSESQIDAAASATPIVAGVNTLGARLQALPSVNAGSIIHDASYIYTVDTNVNKTLDTATSKARTEISLDLRNVSNAPVNTINAPILVWVQEAGTNAPSSALTRVNNNGINSTALVFAGIGGGSSYIYPVSYSTNQEITLEFSRAGEYVVYAALNNGNVASDLINTVAASGNTLTTQVNKISTKFKNDVSAQNKVIVKDSDISSSKYALKAISGLADTTEHGTQENYGTSTAPAVAVAANSVASTTLKFQLNDVKTGAVPGKTPIPVRGATVKIETGSANLSVSHDSVTTNALGQFSFDISGSLEGIYKLYITTGGYTTTIYVQVGATGPAYITTVKEPTGPIDREPVDSNNTLSNVVRFQITDINGNLVDPQTLDASTDEYKQKAFLDPTDSINKPYVSIVSQPSASTLTNENVYLAPDTKKPSQFATLKFTSPLTAEGVYEFKAALDNGSYATVKVEIKEFQTPVSINLAYSAPSVELGGKLFVDKLEYVDANGVTKDCSKYVSLAATGYAVQAFQNTNPQGTDYGMITAKSDEKYIGSKITVTAVDDRYDLITTTEVNVADEASELSFSSKTAQVNVNNVIVVTVVDKQGNRVAVGANSLTGVTTEISYVVLEKPEGAKVSAMTSSVDNNITTGGTFKMILTSNKIGNVKIQAIAKITGRNESTDSNQFVTKYYTGTQTFSIGTGETGNVVVMSIGSNEVIVNDSVKTIDAQPVVQNNRTFVPFRALAEAFGATVAYDEATQAVTAELNGVTVVLTVGSPTYTVNGEEKTADVAPYISGSRTMVPVRFAAEAFGIKVTPTYDENGATADILFNL